MGGGGAHHCGHVDPREGAAEWIEASVHPVVADLFQRGGGASPKSTSSGQLYNSQAEISYGVVPRSSGMATASLVLGIIAFVTALPTYPVFCCCGISIPVGIVGLVLGFVELSVHRDAVTRISGRKTAIAGIVLSVLGVVLALGITGLNIILGLGRASFRFGP